MLLFDGEEVGADLVSVVQVEELASTVLQRCEQSCLGESEGGASGLVAPLATMAASVQDPAVTVAVDVGDSPADAASDPAAEHIGASSTTRGVSLVSGVELGGGNDGLMGAGDPLALSSTSPT